MNFSKNTLYGRALDDERRLSGCRRPPSNAEDAFKWEQDQLNLESRRVLADLARELNSERKDGGKDVVYVLDLKGRG